MSDPAAAAASQPLDPVFRPASVAVVGASADPTKRGHQVLRALLESGYRGVVHPVNPRGGEILGLPAYAAVDDVPGGVDLALVCTPAATAPAVVAACGRRGIRAAVVLAVGFGESGEEGRALERALLDEARAGGVRLVGPNTSGILNLSIGLNLIGARGVRAGSLALVVQSGNMALALMNEVAARTHEGISIAVGVGNQTDLGFADYLEFVGRHDGTRVAIVYTEGFRDARRFLEVAASVSRAKPVLLLKGGRSRAGEAAARSHTGAVAGAWDVLRAGLRQAGVVEASRTDELAHVAETLAHQPPVSGGRGLAVLSDGGGQGTLAVDALTELGAPLATPGEETRARLRSLLGRAAAVGNPVDLAGAADSDPGVFAHALEALAADPAVGGVLVVGLFGGYQVRFAEALAQAEETAALRMAETMRDAGKPLVVHTMYAAHRTPPLRALGRARVPVVESLEVACRCVAETWARGRTLERPPWPRRSGGGAVAGASTEASRTPAPPCLTRARAEGRDVLSEPEARALLAEAGVPFPPGTVCRSPGEAGRAAMEIGGPVALKVVSPHIPHKSDAGGVALDVAGPEAAAATFREIEARTRRRLADRGIDGGFEGVLVSPMLAPPLAELLVGVRRDPDLGPALTLGAGGVWVEVLRDVAHRVLPVAEDDVREMLGELAVGRLLGGARGRPPARLEAVVAAALAVAACAARHPEIAEVEVNPLFLYPDRVEAVDARVFLAQRDRVGGDGRPG